MKIIIISQIASLMLGITLYFDPFWKTKQRSSLVSERWVSRMTSSVGGTVRKDACAGEIHRVYPALRMLQISFPVDSHQDVRCSVPQSSVPNLITFQIDQTKPPYTLPKFDEYGDLPFAEEKQRLDYFAQELKSVPSEPGYIIEYRSKRPRLKPLSRAKRARHYLVKTKGIESKRLFIVDGGYRKEFKLELRLGPTNIN